MGGTCRGITCHKGKIILGLVHPNKLQILDMKGQIQETVQTNANGEHIFDDPDYIDANDDVIYVSDLGKKAVIMLFHKGES